MEIRYEKELQLKIVVESYSTYLQNYFDMVIESLNSVKN